MSTKEISNTFVIILLSISLFSCSTAKKNSADKRTGANYTEDPALGFTLNSDSDSKKAGSLKTVYFDYGTSVINSENEKTLLLNAEFLKKNTNLKIQIEGHCDERGSVQFNLALGEKRSKDVEEFFLGQGISAERLAVVSIGKEHPVSFGHDEDSWKLNRRANFVIIGK
jgi:peptidoglycan-associated lipoprotein